MNRLQAQSFYQPAAAAPTVDDCGAGVYQPPTGDGKHAVFTPLHYEPNYGYPLLVWLHGGSDSERQLRRIMPLVSLRNYVSVAPRGTLPMPKSERRGAAYRWVQTPEHVAQAEQNVSRAIASAEARFHVRPDRIFLAGYECGGTMALRIATEQAGRFAGVLSLCGPFPTQGAPLAKLHVVRQLPLYVAACRQGTYYPTDQVCENLRLFHSAGMSITLREYPGCDSLTPRMLADVDRWIMEQIANPAPLAGILSGRQTGVG